MVPDNGASMFRTVKNGSIGDGWVGILCIAHIIQLVVREELGMVDKCVSQCAIY